MRTATIPTLLLSSLLAARAAAGDVVPGPVATIAGESGFKDKAALAYGGNVYLAVWQDGAESADFDGPGVDIKCARIAADGKVLDAVAIPVCTAKDNQLRPRVAFAPSSASGQGGGVFLVVWEDFRHGNDGHIYAARVTPQGKVLDPDGFPVADARGRNQVYAAVASNGREFLVAWMDFWAYPTYGIAAARVGADGKVTPPGGTLLLRERDENMKKLAEAARTSKTLFTPWKRGAFGGASPATAGFPDLIFHNGAYLLYHVDCFGTFSSKFNRISAEGELAILPVDKKSWPVLGTFEQDRGYNHALVGGPEKGWLFFTRSNFGRGQEEHRFNWFRISPDGALPQGKLEKGIISEVLSSDDRRIIDSNVVGAFDGTTYWLVLEDKPGIVAGRMDPASGEFQDLTITSAKGGKVGGVLLSPAGSSAWCMHPAVASDGQGGVLAVWSEDAGVDSCRLQCRTLRAKKE
jgi:hypothetical protein